MASLCSANNTRRCRISTESAAFEYLALCSQVGSRGEAVGPNAAAPKSAGLSTTGAVLQGASLEGAARFCVLFLFFVCSGFPVYADLEGPNLKQHY